MGGLWGLAATTASGNVIYHNGVIDPITSNVILLLYYNHVVYQENSANNWWSWTSNAWLATTDPRSTVSPSGTTVTTVGPIITDSGLNHWALVTSSSQGLQITLNSTLQTITNNVIELLYYNGVVYQENSSNNWWSWTSGAWVATTNPLAATLIEVPCGVHLGNYLGGGQGTEGSISGHWADVKTGFGLTPAILASVVINSYQDGYAAPSQWGGDNYTWTSGNGLPVDGSVSPMLHGHFTNGSSTDCDYTNVINGTYDTALTNAFNLWKAVAPFKKIYFRINWEFNTDFLGWGVPSSGQITNWVNAYKHWANILHTWGNTNGIKVRMIWCPDTSYTQAASSTFSDPVVNFFPAPDSNAVNGRYIDVIGSDLYMGGYGVKSNFGQTTTPLSSCTTWSLGTFVAMAQAYGCNIGISETGDGSSFDSNNSYKDGTMAAFATYLNTLSTLTPVVPIEYIGLYDINSGGATQCSGGGNAHIMSGWQMMMGNGGSQPFPSTPIPKIMTVAAI